MTISVYIKLFHGRKHPDEQLDDWGADGPVLGPFNYVHTTYVSDIKVQGLGVKPSNDPRYTTTPEEECASLDILQDLVYYDGMYYGDWSVFAGDAATQPPNVEQLDREKARKSSATV